MGWGKFIGTAGLFDAYFLPCIYIQYLFIYYNEIKGWSNASPTKMKIHIENKFTIFPI